MGYGRVFQPPGARQRNWTRRLGEYWWLPEEQAEFVRNQLRQSCADLIERSSDYDDAAELITYCFYVRDVVQAIAVPCDDPARVYVGARRGPHLRVFVWVQSENGRTISSQTREPGIP